MNNKNLKQMEEALNGFEEQVKATKKITIANQQPTQSEISEAEQKLEASWEKFFDEVTGFIGEVQQERYKVLDGLAVLKARRIQND